MNIHPFFLWFLLTLLFGIYVALVSGLCQTDQQSLLAQFNNSLSFNQSKSTRLAKWNLSTDCCDWDGVTCDEDGRVIGLNLSNETISGGIENSSALFSLHYLQNLDLSYNNFNDKSLSSLFANLTSLISLNLSNAGFVGQIPIEISYMKKLVRLDLSSVSYDISGRRSVKLENPNLAKLVQNLTQLIELRLDGVNISASGKEWGQALSPYLPNLQVLSLSNCYLSGPFDSSLATLRYLSVIRLDSNNFSAPVPDFFSNFSNLRMLRVSSCQLQGTFPPKVFQVLTLENIDLSYNQDLQGYLPDGFQNASLNILVLSDTNFSGSLPESIGALGNLTRINLANCKFSGPIPKSMGNLTELVYLDFSRNMFTGPIPSFGTFKKLLYMDFSHNNLSGGISSSHWETLRDLVYIDLRYNSLNGSIPSSLFAIQPLQKLQLSSNHFVGQIPDISNASSLSMDTLDLSNNNLGGPIHHSVFELRRLNVLSLASNKFNGTIKLDQIQRLVNLTSLDLSYNQLIVDATATNSTSSISQQLTTLKMASCNMKVFPDLRKHSKLVYLDLSDNQIGGPVPQWIGEVGGSSLYYLNLSVNLLVRLPENLSFLSSLSVLDLHSNQLRGNIPTPPQSASVLDYSNNNFSSSIPRDFGEHLTFTIFFSLSNNSVEGAIPESLCKGTYLHVLDLSNNNLNGSIPSCLMEMSKSLGVLNLRKNKLDGGIPDKFPGNCELKTLDLSRNLLEGKVPSSLINCTKLEVLDLGMNKISDTFPCRLRNISTLRALILRNNKFYGDLMSCPSISPTTNPTWTKLQIIDIASNNFSGKMPNSILRSWRAMMGGGNETHDHIKFEFLQLSGLYYQDSITVTSKGLQMQLVKILTIFTSIDISCNKFEGPVPDGLGQLSALYVLNLSHNALCGEIPSSLGSVSHLESLDLSNNKLYGEIPLELAGLTFLSVLNLSYNKLYGEIPTSTQLQSFLGDSFAGNEGLCGPPLSKSCKTSLPLESESEIGSNRRDGGDWNYLSVELGYIFGLGITIGPLIYWERGRIWYYKHVGHVLIWIFPRLDKRITNSISSRRRRRMRMRMRMRGSRFACM